MSSTCSESSSSSSNELYDTTMFDSLEHYVDSLNLELGSKSPQEIIQWTIDTFGPEHTALSSSFGITSAVMLHLVMSIDTSIPVVWIDTGYLPKETYQFAAQLTKLLDIQNLRVYQSSLSPARMEALYGKLWEVATPEAHQQYGYIRKVEPMQRALRELETRVLLVGVRSEQTTHRESMKIVNIHDGRLKICPILTWTTQDVDQYMATHALPYHPLKEQGYVTIGDSHSSRPVTEEDVPGQERASRFHGIAQECGLHLDIAMPLQDLTIQLDDPLQEQEIRKLLAQDQTILFTKPTCKYCLAAKEELNTREWGFKEVRVGRDLSIEAVQRIVGEKIKTVPQIFIQGKYIGGYTDLCAYLQISSRFG